MSLTALSRRLALLYPLLTLWFVQAALSPPPPPPPVMFAPASAPEAGCSTSWDQAAHFARYNDTIRGLPFPLCDRAYYSQAYTQRLASLPPITLRVRFHVVTLDDGTEPSASLDEIRNQMQYMNKIYRPGNVTFQADVRKVASSYLRQRNLLPFCSKSQIGDGQCQLTCNNSVTGYDGGDCINLGNASEMSRRRVFCKTRAGDGTCDGECNYAPFSYDDGDCCNETIVRPFKTCVDPSSKLLRWYTYSDFRTAVFQEGLTMYNIGVAPMPSCKWCGGASTLPGAGNFALTIAGGTIMKMGTIGGAEVMGGGAMLTHEVGHILGQGHIFAGVEAPQFNSGPPSCAGSGRATKCLEPQHPTDRASLWTVGDLCPDTPATPVMFGCSKTTARVPSLDCDGQPWQDPAVYNPMGFTFIGPGCAASMTFTACQLGRQRCWIDAMYGTWMTPTHNDLPGRGPPSVVVLAPRATLIPTDELETPVLLEFAAPLYIGQIGAPAQAELLRFHIRVSTSVGQHHTFVTKWSLTSQGQQVNVSVAKSGLVDGESHTFSVRTEGAGGICAIWGTDSNPVMYNSPQSSAPGMSVGVIVLLVFISVIGGLGVFAVGVMARRIYRRRASTQSSDSSQKPYVQIGADSSA